MRFFERISLTQAINDGLTPSEWGSIQKPTRSTKFSAGYDFYLPRTVVVPPKKTVIVPSGIRAAMEKDEFLALYIRSSLGIKKNLRLSNSVGIVDSDYFFAENEGHIQIAIHNDGDNHAILESGSKIMQGIFQKFLMTNDDKASGKRNGGLGSTGV